MGWWPPWRRDPAPAPTTIRAQSPAARVEADTIDAAGARAQALTLVAAIRVNLDSLAKTFDIEQEKDQS